MGTNRGREERLIDTAIISLLLHLGKHSSAERGPMSMPTSCVRWWVLSRERRPWIRSIDLLESLGEKTTINKTRVLDARSTLILC